MCLYPKLIQNPKYKPNKKNNWNPPIPKDPRTTLVAIGCQRCMECRKQKARQWSVRLQEEIRTDNTGKFITLTFSNEHITELTNEINQETDGPTGYDLDNAIATLATRRFLERWRKKHTTSVKHWLVTELGHNGTENIHLHGIIFTPNKTDIKEIWHYGFVYIGDYVNNRTVNYCSKYVMKQDIKHREYTPKILTSAGIGNNYTNRIDATLNKFNGTKTKETYTTRQGRQLNLPIYYRNKIYTEDERELLWLQRLDKQERWILGTRIDISKNNKTYFDVLEQARTKNRRLGYSQTDWERKQYENQQRQLKIQERIIQENPGPKEEIEEEYMGFKKHKKKLP